MTRFLPRHDARVARTTPLSQYFSAERASLKEQPGGGQTPAATPEHRAALPAPRPRQLLRSFPTFTLSHTGKEGQVGPAGWAPFVTVLTGANTAGVLPPAPPQGPGLPPPQAEPRAPQRPAAASALPPRDTEHPGRAPSLPAPRRPPAPQNAP